MKWTLYQAAREWNIHRETLAKGLVAIGETIQKGRKFHTRLVTRAVIGDLEAEKILETRERRKNLQFDRLEKEKRLVDVEEASKLFSEILFPIRQWVLALPASACSRCNPADPQLAREALQRIVDDALPLLRQELPRPKAVSDEEVSAELKLKLG